LNLPFLTLYTVLTLVLLPLYSTAETHNNAEQLRVNTSDIVFEDFIYYPELGITSKALWAIVNEKKRVYGNQMTMAQLHSISDAITQFYRVKGFKFTFAYIAEKTSSSKAIVMNILEGRLGDIKVYNASLYSDDSIKKPFKAFLGKVIVQKNIEAAVLELKSYPGLTSFAYYSRGSRTGEARLNIKVTAEKSWSASVRLDNYGSESTGENRIVSQLHLSSPFGLRDNLTIGLQTSLNNSDGENSSYGLIKYSAPIVNMDHILTLNLSNNQFEVGDSFSSLELKGDAKIGRLNYSYKINRGRIFNQSLGLSYEIKQTDYEDGLGTLFLQQNEEVQSSSIQWQIGHYSESQQWSNQLSLTYYHGDFDSEALSLTGQDYDKLQANFSSNTPLFTPSSYYYSNVSFYLKGQYSDSLLANVDLLSLGGPYSVRAIKSGFFAADRGAIANIEWSFPQLIRFSDNAYRLTPFLFSDYGYGEKLGFDNQSIDKATISGYGIGIDFNLSKALSVRLTTGQINSVDVVSGREAEEQTFLMELNYYLN